MSVYTDAHDRLRNYCRTKLPHPVMTDRLGFYTEMEDGSLNNYFQVKTMLLLALCGLVGCSAGEDTPEATESEATEEDAKASAVNAIDKYEAYTEKFSEPTQITQNHATGHVGDFFFTHWKDGGSASLTLDPDGAFSVSWEGGGYNYVGGPG